MDKIISTRLDESVVYLINKMAHRLHVSKKSLLENAVREFVSHVDKTDSVDVFRETCGLWRRKESSQDTTKKIRDTFEKSMKRYHQ